MKIQTLNVNYMPKIQVQPKTVGVCCPHGSPAGTCPICIGMGGGGGGGTSVKAKPTAKELGLFTWADLLPAWNAMLAARQRQEFNQKLDNLLAIKKFIEQSGLYKALNTFIDNKIMPVIKFLDSKILTPLSKTVSQTIQAVNNLITKLKTQMIQQLTKMSAVINEKIQQVLDKLKNATEIFKNAMEIFISNIKDKEKAVKEFLLAYANKLKKKLFRIVEEVDNSFENLEDQKNNAETFEELINE